MNIKRTAGCRRSGAACKALLLGGLLLVGIPPAAHSQGWPDTAGFDFIAPNGPFTLQYFSDPTFYYILERCPDLVTLPIPIDMQLGAAGIDQFSDAVILPGRAFYRVGRVSLSNPLDTDGDGDDDLYELSRPGLFDPLNPDDPFRHPNYNAPGESPPAAPGGTGGNPVATGEGRVAGWVNGVCVHSGEARRMVTDLRVRGRVMDFAWVRTYRSQHGSDTVQGNGWDFSYNLFLEEDGADLILHSGCSRADRMTTQPGGWILRELFINLVQNPDDSFTATFPNQGTWHFLPFTDPNAPGRINTIADRNGNAVGFAYDAAGRLTTITDDLGRPYALAYNPDGFIATLTDFSGRVVQYDYYEDADVGGSDGDLKSVTSPVVVGTPNGNDFPAGKTTIHTYSEGLADERLNHNLRTVTDGKGQTFVEYVYDATTDVTNFNFDRVVRQVWGDPGDLIDLFYKALVPGPANNFSSVLTVLNDREGHVKDLFSGAATNILRCRERTGLANPDLPTTDVSNLPGVPVRVGDPPAFVTSWDYNPDGQVLLVVPPNQNQVEFTYDGANPDRRLQGNLLEVKRTPGPLGGDQAQLVERYEYEAGFGGCCGTDFVSRHIDARGNQTLHTYDPAGNRLQTTGRLPSIEHDYTYNPFGQLSTHVFPDNGSGHRREDRWTYHGPGLQEGYLQDHIVDTTGFALTTTYQYDPRGNVIQMIDPRGNDSQFTYNALDQVVRGRSEAVATTAGPVRYQTDTFYDANDNVVRVDTENRDGDGNVVPANPIFTWSWDYDVLDTPTEVIKEVDPVRNIVTQFEYDDNRNRTIVRFGEATSGVQPGNVVEDLYDERDLLFQSTRAPGVAGSGGASTNQFDYDGNGNLAAGTQGLQGGTPRVTTSQYDGYDRLAGAVDPMGNTTTYQYDSNGNLVSRRLDGELTDLAGSAGNVRLWVETYDYDSMDRLTRSTADFFDTTTQLPILVGPTPDGFVITTTTWSDNSQILRITDDNLRVVDLTYDSANRRATITDASGNSTELQYDANSNLVNSTEIDKSDLGSPDETFQTTHAYDELDRHVGTVDNLGNQFERRYDSRHNVVTRIDSMRPLVGDPGNVVRYTYDGLNRLIQTERELTKDGTGTGVPSGTITTLQGWDDTNRLTSRTDGQGNATTYTYDELNRLTKVVLADATIRDYAYDPHGNRQRVTDPNGTLIEQTYDQLNRVTDRAVTAAPGVLDTTFETYRYDGLSRLVRAEDDDSLVTRRYDSLSRVTVETLNGHATTSTYDGLGNQLTCAYPGGRVITCTFDSLDRVATVSDAGGLLGRYDYIGRKRVEQRLGGASTVSTYTYDGLRRMTGSLDLNAGVPFAPPIGQRTYSWDQMSNNTKRNNLLTGISRDQQYDSIYRLSTAQATGGPVLQYNYDDAGNRTSVVTGGAPVLYTQSVVVPEPADSFVNQYTTTPGDAREYDRNGNLLRIDAGTPAERTFSWSFRNRLVRHRDTATGIRTDYRYDPLGRRISKIVDVTGAPVETRYFYNGRRVIEDQDGAGTTTATYVYGAR